MVLLIWSVYIGNQSGVKANTYGISWFDFESGEWYTARMRLFSPDSANQHQAQLFAFSNPVPGADHVDVSGYVIFGIPNIWTWIESPVYSFETGKGLCTVSNKAGGTGSVYIDQLQIIKAPPTLIDANRYLTQYNNQVVILIKVQIPPYGVNKVMI